MSHPDLRQTVIEALLEVAPDVDASALDATRAFREQFDFDSMDTLSFVIALHQRLGIDIPERDYPQLLSLDGTVRYLAAHLGSARTTP
ncbi:MAG TPA: acyl carrier protein [Gammaproteobacteria bacterium]|jgi:acyl carrier protein